jgi:hypothetical protein
MRILHLNLILLLSLLRLGPGQLWARDVWAVVARGKLDPRLTRQLSDLARRSQAEVRSFPSADEAARRHAKLILELVQEKNLESFLGALKQQASATPAQLTPELAREGYTLNATYTYPSAPQRIHITAATAAGLHHALLRVPQLLCTPPSKLSTELAPPAKFVAFNESGRTATARLADFPSFSERGIVEGFYGVPWSHQDRLDMLRFEGQHSMNVYYYAPKDDPYHRKLWREPYPRREMKRLARLVQAARENFVDFCFATSPGLSMVYSSHKDFRRLTTKLESVGKLGVSCFALFLDDVPQDLPNPEDRERFKTLAGAHVYLINKLDQRLKSRSRANRLVVTPTTYTNEWGSQDYVRELGAGVNPDVAIVWTGTKVISPATTVAQAKEWGELLRRPPLVWDNFPVNDGIAWRLNLGPLVGREPDLPAAVRGLFSNPMNQAHSSMLPLATVADYLWNSRTYDPKRSLDRALTEQYGKDAAELLAPFLKTYGDYWWDENIFKPLFVEERKTINTREIEARLNQLDESLEALRKRKRFQKLASELSPIPARMRERLALVSADPAFRHLPDQELQWEENYDALYASRVNAPPTIDGDFAKWQGSRFYQINNAAQIAAGARLWRGPSQFSCRVALGWDENNLYIGVDATDPKLYQPFSARDIEQGDAIVLTLETAFRRNFESTEADGDEYHLFFSPGNFSRVEPSVFSDEDYLPPRPQPRDYSREIKMAWKKTPAGFSGDIVIPAIWFEGGKFQTGYEIGLSFGAQKVVRPGKAGTEEEGERIVLSSKGDRLFPAHFGNPSSYQRLILVESENR